MNFNRFIENYFSWNLLVLIIFNLLFSFTFYLDAPNYEFTLLNSILIFFLFGFYSIHSFTKKKFSYKIASLFLLAPIAVSLVSNVLNKNCPFSQNLLIYLLTVFPTIVLSYSISKLSLEANYVKFTFLKRLNKNNFISYSILFILFVFIALESLVEFYFYPQVYFYNPIIGYFSGTIYDDIIDVNLVFIYYRIIILLFSGALIVSMGSKYKKLLIGLVFMFYFLFVLNKSNLSFASDLDRITNQLGKSIQTEHFDIYLPNETDSNKIKNIVWEHEYYFSKYDSIFLLSENSVRIKSFIFQDNDEKRKLFGAGNADVAKPWLKQIYTEVNGFENTLEHELLHIFAANYGSTIFKISHNFNPYLLEGIPVAFVQEINKRDIDYFAKLLKENNVLFAISDFHSLFNFFSVNSFVSYIYAGSFIKFLKTNYGTNSILELYKTGDIKSVFNKDLQLLLNNYNSYLDSLTYFYKENEYEFYFGRAPIYSRICPRELSIKKRSAQDEFANENYELSLDLYSEVYNLSRDPGAFNGIIQNYKNLKEYEKGAVLIERNLESFKNSSYYLFFKLKLADFYYMLSSEKKAFNSYKEIENRSPNFNYYFSSLIRLKLFNYKSVLKYYLKKGLDSNSVYKIENLSKNDDSLKIICDYNALFIAKEFESFDQIEISDFINLPYFEEMFISLSQRLMKIGKYKSAKEVLQYAKHNLHRKEFDNQVNENLKKIDWLTNFAHKIKFEEYTSN